MIGLLVFSLVADGAGYIHRLTNHYPLAGSVPGLPPTILGYPLYVHKGLDLAGGTRLELQLSNYPPGRDRAQVQADTIAVIQNRITALGTREPVVAPAGSNHDRVIVELAGVPASKAQEVIGRTAQLVTTRWVKDAKITAGPFPGYRPEISELRSSMLTSASAQLDQNGTNWVVSTAYNSQGAAIFGQLTTNAYQACPQSSCRERFVADWLDLTPDDVANWETRGADLYRPFDNGGKLLTDPIINEPITGGQAQISGSFTQTTAKDLATLLSSGSLPVHVDVIQSTDVGASLGQDSIKRSLAAGVLGLLIVVIFLISFYRLPGALASIALLFYAAAVLAVFKVFNVTLTLAGMAGFILSVGMAVDANVLIFERFKEEMRSGRTVGAAVEAAVDRAWPAVRDSNTSTLITSVILIFAGTGPVKGFAITLAIGVVVSLFSSIVVTHNLLAIVLNFGWVRSGSMLGMSSGRAV